jgi:ribosomal biogenesis protein LAS1
VPSQSSLVLWSPLLTHIQAYHPAFPSVLTTRIVDSLLYERLAEFDMDVVPFDIEGSQDDPSYRLALAKWAAWIVRTYDNGQENGELSLRKHVIVLLASALAPGKTEGLKELKV